MRNLNRSPAVYLLLVAILSGSFFGRAMALPDCDDTVPKNIICPDGPVPLPPNCKGYDTSKDCTKSTMVKKYSNNFTYTIVVGSDKLATPVLVPESDCWCYQACVWSGGHCDPSNECVSGSLRTHGTYQDTPCTPADAP